MTAAAIAAPRSGYRHALAVPEFRVLWVATSVSICGSVVAAVALTVLVYQRTSSPLLSASTFALAFVPYAFSGALLSAVVDRVPVRRLLVACDAGAAGLVGLMAWPDMPIPALLLLLVGTSVLTSLSTGARGGLVRTIVPVEAYVPARSLLRVSGQLAQVCGNAMGGLLVAALTPSGAILVNAASFAASAAITGLGLQERPTSADAAPASFFRDSLRGARHVFGRRELRRLLLLGWLVPTFVVAPEAVAAPYVSLAGGSTALVGIWLVALPAGMIVGDVLGVWMLTPRAQRRLVGALAAFCFVPYLAFAKEPELAAAVPLLAVAGLGAAYTLGLDQRVRDAAPERLFARAMTINTAGLMTLQGLGFALAGGIAELTSPATAILTAGVCGLTTVALLAPRR